MSIFSFPHQEQSIAYNLARWLGLLLALYGLLAVVFSSASGASLQVRGSQSPALSQAAVADQLAGWIPLIDRLAADSLPAADLLALFSRPEVAFDSDVMGHKMLSLYTAKYGSLLVRRVQLKLKALGYLSDDPDGWLTVRTKAALKAWQTRSNLSVETELSGRILARLEVETIPAPSGFVLPEATKRSDPPVFASALIPAQLAEDRAFYDKYHSLLTAVEKRYGVPAEIVASLLAVESRLGTYLGDKNAFVSLANMARCDTFALVQDAFAYEVPTAEQLTWLEQRTRQKAAWAYAELKALFTYARHQGKDPLAIPGSIYGAIGICQFMPSNVERYGVDGNEDGKVDLFNMHDAVHSLANYLASHSVKRCLETEREQRAALWLYNPSAPYVNTILAVAKYLRCGPALQSTP